MTTAIYMDGGDVKIDTMTYEGLLFKDTRILFRDDGTLRKLFDALQEHFANQPPVCEFCDASSTQTQQDELGNDCRVCDEHAEMLAAKKPERAADQHYEDENKSGEN